MAANPTDLLSGALAELAKVEVKKGSTSSAKALAAGKSKVREARTILETSPPAPAPPPPTASIRWGARMDGSAYGSEHDAPWEAPVWDRFESDAGKKVSLCAFGQPFGALDLNALRLVAARGATSLVETTFPTGEIVAGLKDAAIDNIAAQAVAFKGEVLLVPGWEMNGTWYAWSRKADYIAAWRHLADRLRAKGATNIKFVWAVNGIYEPAADPAPYYPGTEFVDYVGIDAYNWGVGSAKPYRWQTPAEVFDPTLTRLAQIAPGKPVIINETGCTEHGGDKAAWITEFLGTYLPSRPQIVAFSWFNDVADAAGMDWIVSTSPSALAAFKAGIASPYYH
jgi:hypothetical protein